jgi:pyruvate dehydrogenase E2 component (dihydrolipoamide acetyltransferase)
MTESYVSVPLSPLRKAIAARMVEAARTIPHFRLSAHIEMDALLSWRGRVNAVPVAKASINDCLVKACAAALMEHPSLNCQFMDDAIHQYHSADISVLVAVEGGVLAPVIRSAESKSVHEIAAEIRSLAARAAARQLRMDEITGGSFSISNLGAYAVDEFDAIINPPQCAILAVGCAKPRLVVRDGEPHIATVLRATLSVDHRAIDGAVAAKFLETLRRMIEAPECLDPSDSAPKISAA